MLARAKTLYGEPGVTSGRTRSETLQANERIKHAAGVATALANALLIGEAGSWAVQGFNVVIFVAIVGALTAMSIASFSLTMLQAEPRDD